MAQWQWQTVQRYPWRDAQHINLLEVRAALNYLRIRARHLDSWHSRMLFVADSQVVASVVAKGRSSSLRLNMLLRRFAAIQLCTNTRVFIGWCRSEAIPADAPSRWNHGRNRLHR